MVNAAWSTSEVNALLTPFEEDVVGQNDTMVKAVVSRRFLVEANNPRQPRTRHYYALEIRSTDKATLGDLKDNITVQGEVVQIREIADEGKGITRITCG